MTDGAEGLDPASEAELRKALGPARMYNGLIAISGQLVALAQNQNLLFSAEDRRTINYSANRPLGSNCGQMNTDAPTTYGQAPFADHLSEVDEFQKRLPHVQAAH
jgi:hypothetical protein